MDKKNYSMRMVDEKGRLFGTVNLIDMLIISFFLCLLPMGYYSYRSIVGWGPLIIRVIPETMNAHKGGTLVILGKNFQRRSVVKVGDLQLDHITFIATDRLEMEVPPQEKSGRYDLQVINNNGVAAVRRDAITFFIEPEVAGVSPQSFKIDEAVQLIVRGKHFDPSSAVTLGSVQLKGVEYVSSDLLVAPISPGEISPGQHTLSVTNAYATTTLRESVTVMDHLVVNVLMRLSRQESENLRISGRLSYTGEIKSPRILEILMRWNDQEFGRIPQLGNEALNMQWILATVLLPVQYLGFISSAEYSYGGTPINTGSQIDMKLVDDKTVKAVVISQPVYLSVFDSSYRRG